MKGVILAAGYATRFLPASKTIPKEMFPLLDTPVIDYIVREMVDAGITDILLVSSRRKKAMEDYFDREVELASKFAESNDWSKLERITPVEANIFTLRQQHMMGTGNALMLVEPFVQGGPFVVAYPDDVVLGDPPLSKQLIEAYHKTGHTILSVEELLDEDVSRYGVIDPEEPGELMQIRQMVEKPMRGTEPSRFVSYGRYLYTPEIFDALRKSAHSHPHQGEFTQTEAINSLAKLGKVSALQFKGTRYDVGEPLGYVQTSVQLALERSDLRDPLLAFLEQLLKKEENRKLKPKAKRRAKHS